MDFPSDSSSYASCFLGNVSSSTRRHHASRRYCTRSRRHHHVSPNPTRNFACVPNAAAHRKREFYEHVEMGITALTEGQTYWVSNLANASALLYHSFLGCSLYGMREDGEPVVNWTGAFFR